MADLARWAGVSKSTVSRALSGDPRISEETRRRVTELARQLRYQPNLMASGLATRRTNALGLVIPSPPRTFSNPFYLEFVSGVGDYALGQGYTMFFTAGDALTSVEVESLPPLVAQADGFILTEPRLADPRIPRLIEWEKPYVFLGSLGDVPGVDESIWVDGDNAGGVEMVVQHLIELGHRRIGCIKGAPGHVATENRWNGFLKAMEKSGLPIDPRSIAVADYTEEGGRQATLELLERYPEMTALFAFNDLMAIGALNVLAASGKKVPEDVAVAGFDGIHFGRLMSPSLTTAEQPIYEMGRLAAELLIKQIKGEPLEQKHFTLPCRLAVRGSSVAR
ncbi:MAG: LacI family DNA-binding transcriptional regulator [Syntrophothermus sp.]